MGAKWGQFTTLIRKSRPRRTKSTQDVQLTAEIRCGTGKSRRRRTKSTQDVQLTAEIRCGTGKSRPRRTKSTQDVQLTAEIRCGTGKSRPRQVRRSPSVPSDRPEKISKSEKTCKFIISAMHCPKIPVVSLLCATRRA